MLLFSQLFFKRSSLEIAPELLGQYICRKLPSGKIIRSQVTEVEAYEGPNDKASHASKGQTNRNAVMFGDAGVWYVYLCYGVHWMLNIVTGPVDHPAAILIRGTKDVIGPGRLTKHFQIDKAFDGKAQSKQTGLWLERGENILPKSIKRTPRIGVDYAGPLWSKKLYRFVWKF